LQLGGGAFFGLKFVGRPVYNKARKVDHWTGQLVRAGANHWHDPVEIQRGNKTLKIHAHTMGTVLWEMVLQVCMDYSSFPDFRTVDNDDVIRFFEGIRGSQLKATRPRGSK